MKIKCFSMLAIIITLILTACGGLAQSGSGEPVTGGEVTVSPLDPIPGEEAMVRSEVIIKEVEILTLESFPPKYMLIINGDLPTPCHNLRAEVNEPDQNNRINVEIYALVDPDVICVQVIQPFETNIGLGSYPEGEFSLYVNGELAGRIP